MSKKLIVASIAVALFGVTAISSSSTVNAAANEVSGQSESIQRIWYTFNTPFDYGYTMFYETGVPGFGFRGYLAKTTLYNVHGTAMYQYAGYLYSQNVKSIPSFQSVKPKFADQ